MLTLWKSYSSAPRKRQFSFTSDIPPEVFAQICGHLTPDDLFTLLRVCRYFRAMLSSSRSSYTQEIWQMARINYSDLFDHRPPPKGMSEQQFMLLHYWLTRCQFCRGYREWESRVYWPFKVRACRYCLLDRSISKHRLLHEWKVPKAALAALPYISIGSYDIYWIADVVSAELQFRSLREEARASWIEKQHKNVRSFLNDVEEFEMAYKYNMIYWYYKEQESIRKSCMVDDIAAEVSCDPAELRSLQLYETPLEWPPQESHWSAWRHKMWLEAQRLTKIQPKVQTRSRVSKRWSV